MEKIEQNGKRFAPVMKVVGILAILCLCGIALAPAVAAAATSAGGTAWTGPLVRDLDYLGQYPIASQTIGVLTLTRTARR